MYHLSPHHKNHDFSKGVLYEEEKLPKSEISWYDQIQAVYVYLKKKKSF